MTSCQPIIFVLSGSGIGNFLEHSRIYKNTVPVLLNIHLHLKRWAKIIINFIYMYNIYYTILCPGLTCGINIVKPIFLFKTVDLWSYIMPIDRYSHTL